LAVCEEFDGNHIGFLVFDEPGQQQMKDVDLSTLLSWVANNIESPLQVIISTSEDRYRVREALKGSEASLREFDNYVLQPI
jgi:hypothetical protein